MTDILLDEEFDLLFENGDLATGESTEQHQQLLLLCNKGDLREDTTVGVGIQQFLKDEEDGGLLGEIKKEFERDGMDVRKVGMEDDKIVVNAAYK